MPRYKQTRASSAELLRMILPQMGQAPAACNPEHYTIWYEHLAGINRPLSVAVEDRIASGKTLTDEAVSDLYQKHVAEREVQAAERLQHELVRLMEQVGQIALSAGDGMAEYGAALGSCAARLQSDLSAETLREIIEMLASRTEAVRGSTTKLCHDLSEFRAEMQTLRSEVDTLRQEALTDALTGLMNRRGFERAVEEHAGRAGGLAGSSVLLADVDNFKKLNDAYGHLVGDRVLGAIGRVLKARVKGRDSVARWGGEEFTIFLPETGGFDARRLAEQIRTDIARGQIKRLDRDEFIGSVTISIGVAEAGDGERIESLLDRADAALYEAKSTGRNRTVMAARIGTGAARARSAIA